MLNDDSEYTFEEFVASKLYYAKAEDKEIRLAILDALSTLTSEEKSIVLKSIVLGQSLKEISSIQGITELSARKILYNGAIALNQSVRHRDGQIPKIDSTPRTRQPSPITPIKPVDQIIVGLLANFSSTLVVPNNSNNYKASTTINSILSSQLSQGFFEPIGLFVGILKNNIIFQQALIANIPDFTEPLYSNTHITNPLQYQTYYSMGYYGQMLKYVCDFYLSTYYPSSYYFNYVYDVANIMVKVISFQIQSKTFSTDDLTFTNTTEIMSAAFPLGSRKQLLANQDFYFVRVVKYQSLNGGVFYALISGHNHPDSISGLIAWDMGSIDNLQSQNNIACYFGFNWKSSMDSNLPPTIRIFDAYGCVGGIVVSVIFEDTPTTGDLEVFVPESFLKGSSGVNIPTDQLIVSRAIALKDIVTNQVLPTTVGTMPQPLETRDFIAPYSIPQYPVDENGMQQRLVLYSLFNKDNGKQVFG